MITLTSPSLTPGKRDLLTRTRDWQLSLRESLLKKASELADLQAQLERATGSRAALSDKAPFDASAAAKLSGVNEQIKLLSPIVRQAEKILARDVGVAASQVGSVRRDDIKELLRVPLFDQLQEAVAKQIAPLFRKEFLPAVAHGLATDVEPFLQAWFYLNRIAPRPSDAEKAAAWLALTAREIDGIMAGEEIVTFDHETGEVRFLDQRAADALKIDLDELVLDSQKV